MRATSSFIFFPHIYMTQDDYLGRGDDDEKKFLKEEFGYDTDNEGLNDNCMVQMFDDNNIIDDLLKEDFEDFFPEKRQLIKECKVYKLLKYIYNNNRLPPRVSSQSKSNLNSKLKIQIDVEESKRNEILEKYYNKQLTVKQLKNAKDMEYFLAIGYD